MISTEIQDEILKSVDILIKEKMKEISFNYYIQGRVSGIDISTDEYIVQINGEHEKIPCREGLSLKVNDVVLICIPNSNYSFRFIDMKRPY